MSTHRQLGAFGPQLPEEVEVAGRRAAGGDWLPSREARSLKGHEGPVFAVRWNKAGTYCLSCGKVQARSMQVQMHMHIQTCTCSCMHAHARAHKQDSPS
eukprot:353698-Chlamydomonas_euryale.AAC.3